ncbi:hypothetical protein ACFWJ4_17715 [Kitasatospora sp. NPDC127067]|uniref:hypothetical protein n=1 Tax=Kitasatospora sp. NPDC127067 TaxID=3347126 RepID=UPI0036566FC5
MRRLAAAILGAIALTGIATTAHADSYYGNTESFVDLNSSRPVKVLTKEQANAVDEFNSTHIEVPGISVDNSFDTFG